MEINGGMNHIFPLYGISGVAQIACAKMLLCGVVGQCLYSHDRCAHPFSATTHTRCGGHKQTIKPPCTRARAEFIFKRRGAVVRICLIYAMSLCGRWSLCARMHIFPGTQHRVRLGAQTHLKAAPRKKERKHRRVAAITL